MTCPDDGALRSWLDSEPRGYSADLPAHVAGCADCRRRTADLRDSAERAASTLALLTPARVPTAAETGAVLERVRLLATSPVLAGTSLPAAGAAPPGSERGDRFAALRRPLIAAAAAALAIAAVATPAGRSAAGEFLAQFRSERLAPVAVTAQDAQALADLQHLGTVSGDLSAPQPQRLPSLAAAADRVGFSVASPDPSRLPAGVGRTPEILVTQAREVRFTFDVKKARVWLDRHGGKATALPQRFDGGGLVVSVPAAVVLRYNAVDGSPGMVVGQARQIEARAEGGVGFEELRSFLLDLPGLSPSTRAQLAAIGDWRRTLPLPIPAGQVRWTATTIAGAEGLLLGDNTGLGSAVVWQRNGRIFGVAAPAPARVVQDVAASLH